MANKVQLEAILKLIDAEVDSRVLQKISRATAGLPNALGGVGKNAQNASSQIDKLGDKVNNLRSGLNDGERAARLLLQRMTQFAILLPTFVTINHAIQGSIGFLVDFDKEVRQIIALNPEILANKFDKISSAAFKVADATRTSALDAAKGIKLFVQAGFDLQKSIELAETSALAAKVSTLQVADAQELAIAVTKIYGDKLGSLSDAFDKIVAVEDLTAADAQDLADAFKSGGNALALFTKSLDGSIAFISALREQTRKSGKEIGTFAKTLASRISAAGEAQNAIRKLGVQVTTLNGDIRPGIDILTDLGKVFDGLSESEQANAAKAIAGSRQYESFIATMESLDRIIEINKKSQDSFGTVQEKNAILAKSISEQFSELIVAGQKVAKALGEAGVSDALITALDAGKGLLKVLEEAAKLINKLGSSAVPLLTLFGGAGVASVLGFGGGARNILGFGNKASAATGGGASANTQINELGDSAVGASAAIAKLQQQAELQATVDKISIDLQQENIRALSTGSRANEIYANTIGAVGNTLTNFGKTLEEDAGVRIVALSTAATLAAPAISLLSKGINSLLPVTNLLGKTFQEVTGAGLQNGLQFAVISKNAGLLAGSLATISTAFFKLKPYLEDDEKAIIEKSDAELRAKEIAEAQSKFGGSLGRLFASQLQRQVGGHTAKELDLNAILKNTFQQSADIQVEFIKSGLQGLKESFFSKEGIAQLAKLDPSQFINEDAFKKLQNSFDSTGKSSLSLAEQTKLLFTAMGQVDESFVTVTDNAGKLSQVVESSVVETFSSLKDLASLIKEGTGLQDLSSQLNDFKLSIRDLPEGVDALKIAAERANEGFLAAKDNADKLRDALVNFQGPNQQIAPSRGREILTDVESLIRKNGAGAQKAFAAYLEGLNQDQRDFAKEAFVINKDIIESESNRFKATQEYNKAIYEETKKVTDDGRTARINAGKALDDFKISLLEFGVAANTSNVDIQDVAKSFETLTEEQKKTVSERLPADQSNLKDKFIDQQRAELELANTSKIASLEIDKVNQEIAGIDEQISKLKTDSLTDSYKKQAFENEKTAKQLEIENIKRKKIIDTIKAQIKVFDSQRKLDEELRKSAENRTKADEKLEEESHALQRTAKDTALAFKDFELDRITELAHKESDAFKQLQDAQKEVKDKTADVSTAFKDYVKALLDVNGAIVTAKVTSNLLQRDINNTTGGLVTFQDELQSLNEAFTSALANANISLEKRIELEKELAQQTLDFLKQTKEQIQQAGLNVFGQTGTENQKLGQGIAALSFVVDQLGGSFQAFLNLSSKDFDNVSKELLSLPQSLRQSILDALSALPSGVSIGGFNVDQLKQALGAVGAGVAPQIGLPSIEDLTSKEVEQIQALQALATKDAQIQYGQLAAANLQLQKAEEALTVAKGQQAKDAEDLKTLKDQNATEIGVLEAGNEERQALTKQIIAANDTVTLRQIEEQARLFAEQNTVFRDVGKELIQAIETNIGAKIRQLEAADAIAGTTNATYNGYIPNFSKGNLSPREAAGLIRAASIEKRHMPTGAGLAVANTSEAIIPMRNKGFIPNYVDGSPIAAGIEAVKGIDKTAVAAISASISQVLKNINNSGDQETSKALTDIADALAEIKDKLADISGSNLAIQANTSGGTAGKTTTVSPANAVNIQVQTNQNQQINVSGLDALPDAIEQSVKEAANQQVDELVKPLVSQIKSVITILKQRGLLSSLGQAL